MTITQAAENNETNRILELINKNGFDPNSNEAFGALCTTIKLQNLTAQQALIDKGVGKGCIGNNGDRLIHVLARAGSTSLSFALRLEENIDVENDLGETALSLATAGGHEELVNYLLVNGAQSKATAVKVASTDRISKILLGEEVEPEKKTRHFCHLL